MHAAYDAIYFELKSLIERGKYDYMAFLPSESTLVKRYGCAHNTVRKALAALATDGYVQPIHGKGVRVIHQASQNGPTTMSNYIPTNIDSFKKAGERNGFEASTKVLLMEHTDIESAEIARPHFDKDDALLHLERVRYYDGRPLAREINYFRADVVEGLTKQDAEDSVYDYIETKRGVKLVTSKRRITVERTNKRDAELLELDGTDYLAVIRLITFDGNGLVCEVSELRHHPDVFSVEQTAIRSRVSG